MQLTIFEKRSVLDVWHGSEYASVLHYNFDLIIDSPAQANKP